MAMIIASTIDVEDFVYVFYKKAADDMGSTTPEQLMSQAWFAYAGIVALHMQKQTKKRKKKKE